MALNKGVSTEFIGSLDNLEFGFISIDAILNRYREGVLYIGVNESGNIVGIPAFDKEDFINKINSSFTPSFTPVIDIAKISPDKALYIVRVCFKATASIYAYNDVTYDRKDDTNYIASPELIDYFTKNNTFSTWEKSPSNFTLYDVDGGLLKMTYSHSLRINTIPFKTYNKLEYLKYFGLTSGEALNNAGASLVCTDKSIPAELALYPTNDTANALDYKVRKGNILYLLNEIYLFISQSIRWKSEKKNNQRITTPEIPLDEVLYAAITALSNYDVTSNKEIMVELFPNKLAISYPVAKEKNTLIASFLNKLCRVPKDPSFAKNSIGNNEVIEFTRQPLYPEPEIKEVFIEKEIGNFVDSKTLSPIEVELKDFGGNLVARDVFNMLKENPYLKKSDLALALKCSEKTIQRAFGFLLSTNRITRIGNYKIGYWKINE